MSLNGIPARAIETILIIVLWIAAKYLIKKYNPTLGVKLFFSNFKLADEILAHVNQTLYLFMFM